MVFFVIGSYHVFNNWFYVNLIAINFMGLRWRSGQSARLSPLRLRVRFSVRMSPEPSALLMRKESVNTLPKGASFLRALRFPSTRKLTGWVRINTDRGK